MGKRNNLSYILNKTLTKTLAIVAVFVLFMATVANVHAADLTVICDGANPDDGCVMLPASGAALFGEFEDLNWDVKPGDNITRKIIVRNDGSESCNFAMKSLIVLAENPVDFSKVLFTALKENEIDLFGVSDGSSATSIQNLHNLFGQSGPLHLTSIDPASSKEITWLVTFDKSAGNAWQMARVEFEFDMHFSCEGDTPEPRSLLILSKTNNKLGITNAPGDFVEYTLFVENPIENNTTLYDVELMDLPPEGFAYETGSWSASSNYNGDIKNSPVTEPTYASPGAWTLGTMLPGEVITLKYNTHISLAQESGTYPDLAYTFGYDNPSEGALVIGNVGTGIYVGTEAIVDQNPELSGEAEVDTETEIIRTTGEVLGASTSLPQTGASDIWMRIVLTTLVSGLLLIAYGFVLPRLFNKPSEINGNEPQLAKSASTAVKTFIFGILAVSALYASLTVNLAYAGPFAISIEQQKSPNNLDNFNLQFVVLDIENRPIDVDCYYQKPDAAVFSLFDAKNIIAGGNAGNCFVSASLIDDEGTYKFYVKGTAGADTYESAVISVVHDSDKPGKPKYIEKDKIDSCTYKVKFKTSNDNGDTTRVEVYRSEHKEFTADATTRIEDISIGSNQTYSFNNTIPECGKTYYYAARAFDSAGNGSTLVTEVITKTKTESSSESGSGTDGTGVSGAQGVAGGLQAGTVSQIPSEGSGEGVTGDVNGDGVSDGSETDDGSDGTVGDVLGESEARSFLERNFPFIIIGLLAILIPVLYAIYSKSKKNNFRNYR